MASNISDYVISVLYDQSLKPISVISQSLTLVVIVLGAVLLHDVLVRSKHLNVSWLLSHDDHVPPPAPPGPWFNLPLLGYLPWLGRRPYVALWNLSRRYGNVFQVRFGSRRVVVLSGRETIREAFVRQGDTFAGRPDFPSWAVFCEGRSLAFSSIDADWITQHRVCRPYSALLVTVQMSISCCSFRNKIVS